MTLPRAYKTRGVVLRARPLGEADRIVTLFTAERGKLDAVAKGVRRPRARLAGAIEFGNECVFGMHRGRSLDVIVSADIVRAAWSRLVDPERFAVGSLLAETIASFCEPDLALPDVYELLTGALIALAASSEPQSLLPRFWLRLLDALGIAPPLDRCILCDGALAESAHLGALAGGLLCDACAAAAHDPIPLDADDLANLRALAAPRGARAALRARVNVARGIEQIVTHHLGRRLKAGAQLAELAAR